jgi:SpoVK/Ycf46/Vps4 family AAA+-type ATPase
VRQKLIHYIRAGYPGLYIVSHEENRVEAELKAVADELGYGLHAWSTAEGLIEVGNGNVRNVNEPLEAIWAANELPENALVIFRDIHLFLEDPNPMLIRTVKESLRTAKTRGKTFIFLGCRPVLPPELEREITLLHFALPDKPSLGIVLDGICDSAGLDKPIGTERDLLLDAASGLTTTEAENAYALSVVEGGKVMPEIVAREKAATVKKSGLLEIHDSGESLDDIGGLDVLKDWLVKRKDAFSLRATEYGLPSPKGLLIIGIPGTGKSLTAKAVATVFQRPLLKLDAGRLYGGLVGQSEGNLRSVIETAEAIAPCVLWLDEIEKGFSGSKSSGMTDGGTSSRVFGSFISWMQEKTKPVFVVATANDVTQLPPEFLRKGRFDELFFVDLPNQSERELIWAIQIAKYGRDSEKYDIGALAKATEGFTGAEIEQVFIDALYAAFANTKEPSMLGISMMLKDAVPLSRLMAEPIKTLREWSKGRARLATAQATTKTGRKIAA